MKKTLFTFFALLASLWAMADAVRMQVYAPRSVAAGEEFQIKYVVNADGVEGFAAGKFPAEFNVLYGPSTSRMSSVQIVNGRRTSSSSVTYTYTLSVDKKGSYTLPAASARVGGHTVRSASQSLTVSGAVAGRAQASAPAATAGVPTGKDLFIEVHANKQRVYEQEALVLTYKVFTRVDLRQLGGKVPDLKGFLIQEVPLPQQKTFHVERYNGRNYNATVWSQYVMFPQQSGKLSIPSIEFEGVVSVPRQVDDLFDDFFNGPDNATQIRRKLRTPPITITVDKLPAPRPAGYSEAVGNFNISAKVVSPRIRTNENMTLRFVVSGVGNMKLIQAPKLKLSSDFDVYDPAVTNKTRLTAQGIEGSMIYDYVIVPKHQGNYTLPPIEFVYFNPATRQYVTKRTAAIPIKVQKGRELTEEEYAAIYKRDIRGIHTAANELYAQGRYAVSPLAALPVYGLIAVAGVLAFVLLRRRLSRASDAQLQSRLRARKASRRYLKAARRHLQKKDTAAFYQALAGALREYTSARLRVPMADYSLEAVAQMLQQRGVPADKVEAFSHLVSECDYAQYAPVQSGGTPTELLARAEQVIADVEDNLKQ